MTSANGGERVLYICPVCDEGSTQDLIHVHNYLDENLALTFIPAPESEPERCPDCYDGRKVISDNAGGPVFGDGPCPTCHGTGLLHSEHPNLEADSIEERIERLARRWPQMRIRCGPDAKPDRRFAIWNDEHGSTDSYYGATLTEALDAAEQQVGNE